MGVVPENEDLLSLRDRSEFPISADRNGEGCQQHYIFKDSQTIFFSRQPQSFSLE